MPSLARVATGPAPVPAQYEEDLPGSPRPIGAPNAPLSASGCSRTAILSRDHTVSCQDCHKPELAFTDGKKTAHGMEGHVGPRNTPTVVNRALGKSQFWDGRAATLEEQALGPIAARGEMDLSPRKPRPGWPETRPTARRSRRPSAAPPTPQRIAPPSPRTRSTIYSVDAPFDRYLAGDESALSPEARRGLALFGGKARCSECHSGIELQRRALPLPRASGRQGPRRRSGLEKQSGEFKTPTLREIALTGPYMHDGLRGHAGRGRRPLRPWRHAASEPGCQDPEAGLSAAEKAELVAFMKGLSGKVVEVAEAERAPR